MRTSSLLLAVALCSLAAFNPTYGATPTYRVTSLGDTDSPGTLRWAISQANGQSGSRIVFDVTGTIELNSALPGITSPVTIDGTTAPGFIGAPLVGVDFKGEFGLSIAEGANNSVIKSVALGDAGNSALTILASNVTLGGNYIGLTTAGTASPNLGDGIKIISPSKNNLIGDSDSITGIDYFDTSNTSDFTIPVTAWQGLRNFWSSSTDLLICGTSGDDGLLYIGPLAGGGSSFKVDFPGAIATSVYGPDNGQSGSLRLVGSYRLASDSTAFNHGFVWDGTTADLPSAGSFRTIDYPGAKYQFTHSTMGDLAVGNADAPTKSGTVIGPGIAYIYNVVNRRFIARVVHRKSKSNTAYGIWYNGGTSYTICGGYSPIATNNLTDQSIPLTQGKAYLVDFDSRTHKFTNWASFDYPNGDEGTTYITHFEGISSAEPGVYTLSADSVASGSAGPVKGSWVSVRRNADGKFTLTQWVDLKYPGQPVGVPSSNSVYGNDVVGIVFASPSFAYQATINIGFQLSNVISGNKGNGISLYASSGNVIAQNYIGTNPSGAEALGNGLNGILLSAGSTNNLIGGQEAAANNPTGSKGKTTPIFVVPPQGNLISANLGQGVQINGGSSHNTLSGNFIGTDATGNTALGNAQDGVNVDRSNNVSLIGCTFYQNPFVFYNVISGNGRDGIRINNADNATVHANFIGIGAKNDALVANGGNGITVMGSSKNTQVGGVIPLGNVTSGNAHNGISVLDTAKGFTSFNTFGGVFAFGDKAPNGWNGVYLSSTGGKNTVRTCIMSGNLRNGIEIGGNASGVEVIDTACGTNTFINAALPNLWNGVQISGTAHGNTLGGFAPSVETRTHFAGNLGYGVSIVDQAHDNVIINSNIGLGFALSAGLDPAIPNQAGGILLDLGTSNTTIGGNKAIFRNRINSNVGGGLTIWSSPGNDVINNEILSNTEFGIFAIGVCTGTRIIGNTVTGNGTAPADNIDISQATGITFKP